MQQRVRKLWPSLDYSGGDLGFYLVEILLSILLFGFVAVYTVPSLSQLRNRLLMKSEAKRLGILIHDLSISAIKGADTPELRLTNQSYGLWRTGVARPELHKQLPSPIQIEQPDPERTIEFYKSGVSSPVTVKLSDGKRSCTVTLALRGRVRIKC